MSVRKRRSPVANVDAVQFIGWLDSLSHYDADVDGKTRLYINNVHPEPDIKRELRRYRHGHVVTLRAHTANRLSSYFNLKLEDMQ